MKRQDVYHRRSASQHDPVLQGVTSALEHLFPVTTVQRDKASAEASQRSTHTADHGTTGTVVATQKPAA